MTRPIGAALLCAAVLQPACRQEPPRPNVVVVLVDTLRKDHLGLHGYPRATSPSIDALARRGWVMENHVATASQTVPSTLSMLLALYPAEHGFSHRAVGQFAANRPRYPDELRFVQEVFRDAGYDTAGFVGNPFLQEGNGFDQGFATFAYSEGPASTLTDPAIRWMEGRGEDPFFLYVHYFDVHWPYDPPPPYRGRFPVAPGGRMVYSNGPISGVTEEDLGLVKAMYDAAIAYVDDEIGRLLATLDRLGVRDDTIVVVTSDHGEEFLEHGGMGHGTTVYGELVRVPLVMAYPPELPAGRRLDHLTSHVALAPTLLRLARIEREGAFDADGILRPADRAFAEDGPWRAVYAGGRNLVHNRKAGTLELFRADDELDRAPLPEAEDRSGLLGHLDWYRSLEATGAAATNGGEWTAEEAERLRSLGYVR